MNSHTGRPRISRARDGGVTFLCPYGHLVHYVRPEDWAGSLYEALATDAGWNVECFGALPHAN